MIDRIAAKEDIKMNTIQSKALIGIGERFIYSIIRNWNFSAEI